MGRLEISSCVRVSAWLPLSVSTTGNSPVTSIWAVADASCKRKSRMSVCPTLTTTSLWISFWKPEVSTVTLYEDGGSPVKRYPPSVSVTAVRRIPFSESSAVTVAFGTVPPVGSVTVPRISADVPVPWARVTLFAGIRHAKDRIAAARKVALISPPGSANRSRNLVEVCPRQSFIAPSVSEWAAPERPRVVGNRSMPALPICMEPSRENLNQPGMMDDPMSRRTIRNYDCPYHIILTNVKTKTAAATHGSSPGARRARQAWIGHIAVGLRERLVARGPPAD